VEIKWLKLALADLDEIFKYIKQDNSTAASRVIEHIWDSVDKLEIHPGMGRTGRVAGTRELIIPKSTYLVPYRVIGNEIQILRILHSSQAWPKDF